MNDNRRKNRRRLVSVIIAISVVTLLVFSAVSAQNLIKGISGPSEGTITGIVRDAETNYPIPNALMTLEYHDTVRTGLTDSKGQYTFTNVPLCFCMKNVSASKDGYENQYKLVAVYKITYVDFSLEPIEDSSGPYDGVLTGVVTDAETNEPIPDALMTLKYHDTIRTELTDSKGQYTFTNVPLCFCMKNISAYKGGYESQYKLVDLQSDQLGVL